MRLADPAAALEVVRRHPRHLVLAALVAGLLAAPLPQRWVLVIAGAAAAVGGRAALALLAAVAVLAGALGAQARLAALDRTQLGPLLGATVTARAVLLEQPRSVRYGATALVRLRAPAAGERVMLRIGSRIAWPPAATGAIVLVSGRLRRLGPYEQHYARRGAHAAITVASATPTGARRGGAWRLVDVVRGRAEAALDAGLARPQRALLRGMVLGQDHGLDARQRDDFRDSGLSHLVAASGQNVALLAALALIVLTWAGAGLRPRLAAVLALIALYVPLAGAGPSIQRAGLMGGATIVAALAGRPASRWYALLLAAALTLAWNPRASGDPGWQLSFAAVVAIALVARGARRWLRRRRVPPVLADAAAITFAATVGTAPLIAFHFSELSLVSLAANILAEPAVAPIMWLGMGAATLGQLAAPLALALNGANAVLLGYVGWVAHTAAGVPHAVLAVSLHGPAALVGAYAAIGLLALAVRQLGRRRALD
ncbi:MAG: ComEC/Rec2-related protein [Conexibacter sp.]|nr:ComEC/Rec2-related protein [Conexibacter sp.]